jgi:hypothetical protein
MIQNARFIIWSVVLCVFVITGGVLAWKTAIDYGARELVRQQNGGDTYALLTADVADEHDASKDEVALWINATGPLYDVNYWVSPVSAKRDPHDPDYWRIKGGYLRVVKPGGVMVGKSIARGSYFVEFNARNGSWVELIEVGAGASWLESKTLQ